MIERTNNPRFRPVYNGPACSDISRSIAVCVKRTTGCAGKNIVFSVSKPTTDSTDLTGIGWIDILDHNTCSRGLVFNKLLKLVERPARHHSVCVPVPNPCPSSNIRQLFQPQSAAVVPYRFVDDGFAENMVLVSNVPLFFSGESAQNSFTTLRVVGLQTCPNLGLPIFVSPSGLPVVESSSGRARYVPNTEVNSHNAGAWRHVIHIFHDNVDKPLLSIPDQSSSSRSLACKSKALVFSKLYGNMQTAMNSRDRHGFIPFTVIEDSSVVVNTRGTKFMGLSSTTFRRNYSLRNSPNCSYNKIRGQRKLVANFPVNQSMKLYIVRSPRADGNSKNAVASLSKNFCRSTQCLYHEGGWGQTAFDSSFTHSDRIHITHEVVKHKQQLLDRLKAEVSIADRTAITNSKIKDGP